ncbi:MFS transporter [Arenibaculum sp.]|uniref:MFS transporter n=1 Tax=Arenibaculum sp. TaxID=2865862 RepID=UPI002E0F91A0|nr:MFS transporter [Arenibaculum sp.]
MPQIALSVSSLLLGVALLMLGSGLLSTLVGVELARAGADSTAIGFAMAAYYAGLTVASLKAHVVIAGVGHIRAFAAFASVFSAAALAHAILPNLAFWAVLRLIEGFCMAGLFMCIESWLNDRATPQTRGQLLSLYMITVYGAMGLGQQLLVIDDPAGTLRFIATSILLSLALVPVSLTRATPPVLPHVESFGIRRLWRISPLGIFGTFASGIVTGAIYGLAPVFGERSGFGTAGTALFMTVIILGGVVLQWPLGRLSDVFDRRTVVIGLCAALTATSVAMIAVAGIDAQWPLLAVTLLFGGLSFTLYPICVAHTNDHLDRSELVQASGGLILAYSAGATIGPLAASATMSALGPWGLFAFTAAGAFACFAFGLWRTRVRPPVPVAEQGPFLALPRTTPVITPLDPRSAEEPEDEQLSLDLQAAGHPAEGGGGRV